MTEIPIFRVHSERMEREKFLAIAEHLGLRGDPVATDDALFLQDKQRALAYAMPGSRLGGLLFYTDQTQGIAEPVERAPATEHAETWTREFLKRFHLDPQGPREAQFKLSFSTRVVRTDSATEQGERGYQVKRTPVKTDIVSDLRVNDMHVTGPRAKLRLTFKNGKGPAWIHRGLWENLEVFETRPMLTEHEAFHKLSGMISSRDSSRKEWSMINIRLAYFAGEFAGGPDLLLPYYFAEVEFRNLRDGGLTRQGPRRLIQIPATP